MPGSASHALVCSGVIDQGDFCVGAVVPSFDIKAFFGLDAIYLDTLFKKTSRQFSFIRV